MHVEQIMLYSDAAESKLEYDDTGVKDNNLQFSLQIDPSDNKPWPYEITFYTQYQIKDTDTVLFDSTLEYAVSFSEPLPDSFNALDLMPVVWPFVRPDLISQMRRYGVGANSILPLYLPSVVEENDQTDEQTNNTHN